VSRFTFVLLDLTTLIEAALARERYATFVDSAAVASLRLGALLLLRTLDRNFPTHGGSAEDAVEAGRDSQSYLAAVEILARAGIHVQVDGMERYVALRRDWEPLVRRVAPTLGYPISQIDRRSPVVKTVAPEL
jgi:hypothetical protein